MELVANLVLVLHLLLVAAIVWAPFSGNELAIVMHATLLPFVFAHWLMGRDECCLTVLECYCRGVPVSESFFSRLIGAVYRVGYDADCHIRRAVWISALALWGVSVYRVSMDPGMLKRTFFPVVERKPAPPPAFPAAASSTPSPAPTPTPSPAPTPTPAAAGKKKE